VKIYILTDIEGVSGVVNGSQTTPEGHGYEKACEWLTMDVNAAVQGAIDGGATEIVVLDGHGANDARNMHYDKLHDGAQYIQGVPWTRYLPEFDSSFDGAFFVGAHGMAGTAGAIREHSFSSQSWMEMRVNGEPMGEIGIYAAAAGDFGVPFLMVSGDDKACEESTRYVPDVERAVVKYGLTRHCAKLLPLGVTGRIIREKAALAMKKIKKVAPYKIPSPVDIEVDFCRNEYVDSIRERAGVTKIGPRTVRFSGNSVLDAFYKIQGG
jgi:D-amino peptidase